MLDTLLIDEGARRQQEVEQEQEKDEGHGEDEDEGPQQEANIVAPPETAARVGGSPRPANRRQSLPNDELNSTDSAEDNKKKPRPAKREQLFLSHDGLTRKKRRRPL